MDPEWERLADALKRVTASGVAESRAKLAICNAIVNRTVTVRLFIGNRSICIANRTVTFRLFIGNFERGDIFLLEGWERDVPPSRTPQDYDLWRQALTGLGPRPRTLIIPSQIAPDDFDWHESQPLKPWRDPQDSFRFFDWHGDRVELCTPDVTRVLIPSTTPQGEPRAISEPTPPAKRRPKSATKLETLKAKIKEHFTDKQVLASKSTREIATAIGLPKGADLTTLRRALGRKQEKGGK